MLAGMCWRCDGYSEKQVHDATEMQILVHGWSVAAVEATRPWCYSIGVLERFGHPELVVMDIQTKAGQALINFVGALVRDGDGIADQKVLKQERIRLVTVHERHVRSELFAMWSDYYGESPKRGDFVQILPPPQMLCPCHRHAYRRLDRVQEIGRRRDP